MALTKQISSRALILSPTTAEVTTTQTISPYYDFKVSGDLNLIVGQYFDCGRYINADQDFVSVKVMVRVGGTARYNIQVKSYNMNGGDEIVHVNSTAQQFPNNNSIYTLSFIEPEISAERTLVMYIEQNTPGTTVQDFSLTLVSSLFADLEVVGDPDVITMKGPNLTNTQSFNLMSHRALAITPTGVNYATASTPSVAQACIGISSSTTAPGGPITLVTTGLAKNAIAGLGFTAGSEIYLGLNGALVNSVTAGTFPTGYVIKQLGFALNSTDMWVQIADEEIIS